jgi:BirA family biotin operon repressor/biotin-[acetyl-CoA-carboxylase] ligase
MSDSAAPVRWDTSILPVGTRRIGRPLWHYETVASTMPLAHELAAAGAPDGTTLIAEEQTAGRGRRGRAWAAPRGSAILCSLICRPPLRPDDLFLLTAAVSVGLCAGVARATGLHPRVKWPNDLLLDGRKLAGVLCESRFAGAGLAHAVVGFGLNVNLQAADFPGNPGALPPTSLALALGRTVDRMILLSAILEEIDATYDLLWQGQNDRVRDDWQRRLAGLGEAIRVETEEGPLVGNFIGVDRTGALLLRTGEHTERILVGDVITGPRPAPAN